MTKLLGCSRAAAESRSGHLEAARRRRTSSPPSEGLDPRELLRALVAFKKGDFSVRLPGHLRRVAS